MVEKSIVINNPSGLHVRPAGELAKVAKTCSSSINIIYNGKSYNAKSPVSIISAGIKKGSKVTIECFGDNEQRDLQEILDVIRDGLGEQIKN